MASKKLFAAANKNSCFSCYSDKMETVIIKMEQKEETDDDEKCSMSKLSCEEIFKHER
jgi:hypothetical protein